MWDLSAFASMLAVPLKAIWTSLKAIWKWFRSKKREVKELNERLLALITALITIKSRKQKIDRTLKEGSKEKTPEYRIYETIIAIRNTKFFELTTELKKIYYINFPIPPKDKELDEDTANDMIKQLQEKRPKIETCCKFFKLAKVSRKIKELHEFASDILVQLKNLDNLMVEKQSNY